MITTLPSVTAMIRRCTDVLSRLESAQTSLSDLLKRRPKYTREYFADQWGRQRMLQGTAISKDVQDRTERLGVLLQLEEQLFDAR